MARFTTATRVFPACELMAPPQLNAQLPRPGTSSNRIRARDQHVQGAVPEHRLATLVASWHFRSAERRYPSAMPRKKGDVDLSNIWLFSTCTDRELRLVRRSLEEVTAPAGRVLCEEGEIGREFFFIAQGRASVRRSGRKVALLGPGDYFGELALLDRQPRSATVIADTDMTLLNLTQRNFYSVLDEIPALARKLLAAMAGRLRDADSKVSALISH